MSLTSVIEIKDGSTLNHMKAHLSKLAPIREVETYPKTYTKGRRGIVLGKVVTVGNLVKREGPNKTQSSSLVVHFQPLSSYETDLGVCRIFISGQTAIAVDKLNLQPDDIIAVRDPVSSWYCDVRTFAVPKTSSTVWILRKDEASGSSAIDEVENQSRSSSQHLGSPVEPETMLTASPGPPKSPRVQSQFPAKQLPRDIRTGFILEASSSLKNQVQDIVNNVTGKVNSTNSYQEALEIVSSGLLALHDIVKKLSVSHTSTCCCEGSVCKRRRPRSRAASRAESSPDSPQRRLSVRNDVVDGPHPYSSPEVREERSVGDPLDGASDTTEPGRPPLLALHNFPRRPGQRKRLLNHLDYLSPDIQRPSEEPEPTLLPPEPNQDSVAPSRSPSRENDSPIHVTLCNKRRRISSSEHSDEQRELNIQNTSNTPERTQCSQGSPQVETQTQTIDLENIFMVEESNHDPLSQSPVLVGESSSNGGWVEASQKKKVETSVINIPMEMTLTVSQVNRDVLSDSIDIVSEKESSSAKDTFCTALRTSENSDDMSNFSSWDSSPVQKPDSATVCGAKSKLASIEALNVHQVPDRPSGRQNAENHPCEDGYFVGNLADLKKRQEDSTFYIVRAKVTGFKPGITELTPFDLVSGYCSKCLKVFRYSVLHKREGSCHCPVCSDGETFRPAHLIFWLRILIGESNVGNEILAFSDEASQLLGVTIDDYLSSKENAWNVWINLQSKCSAVHSFLTSVVILNGFSALVLDRPSKNDIEGNTMLSNLNNSIHES